MIIIAREVDIKKCPPSVLSFGYGQPNKVRVTVGRQYIVHAISMLHDCIFYQVVDDLDYPAWYPAWYFDGVDMSLPTDWICNIQRTNLQLIMGPSFIAKTEDA